MRYVNINLELTQKACHKCKIGSFYRSYRGLLIPPYKEMLPLIWKCVEHIHLGMLMIFLSFFDFTVWLKTKSLFLTAISYPNTQKSRF